MGNKVISDFCIIPECFVDTTLIETLVKPREKKGIYNHQHGCFQVAREMQSKRFTDLFALGIIDDDANKPPYFKEFVLLTALPEGLKLYRHSTHPARHHYFIVIAPAAEVWILNACKELAISLKSYGLPDTLKELKAITKTRTLKKTELEPLFSALRQACQEGTVVHTLIKWISVLRDKNFDIQPEDFH